MQRSLFEGADIVSATGRPAPDGQDTHPIGVSCLSGPSFRRASKAARAAAWQAWEDAGQPWPLPDAMGAVLDHALDACAADPMRAKWRR